MSNTQRIKRELLRRLRYDYSRIDPQDRYKLERSRRRLTQRTKKPTQRITQRTRGIVATNTAKGRERIKRRFKGGVKALIGGPKRKKR